MDNQRMQSKHISMKPDDWQALRVAMYADGYTSYSEYLRKIVRQYLKSRDDIVWRKHIEHMIRAEQTGE